MGVAYAIRAVAHGNFEDTVARAREELAHEGFGVLSEIDVAAKMKEKLDKDMQPYLILGACAPPLAWKALQSQPDLGVLLPCNVVVYVDAEGRTIVSAMEPRAALELIGDPVVDEVAKEVSARLQRVVDRLVAA
jgi:uncharacterized protein (DUF302 family)